MHAALRVASLMFLSFFAINSEDVEDLNVHFNPCMQDLGDAGLQEQLKSCRKSKGYSEKQSDEDYRQSDTSPCKSLPFHVTLCCAFEICPGQENGWNYDVGMQIRQMNCAEKGSSANSLLEMIVDRNPSDYPEDKYTCASPGTSDPRKMGTLGSGGMSLHCFWPTVLALVTFALT